MLAPEPPPPINAIAVPGLDAIYVLSVKTFADRIAHVQKQMALHQLAFEFVFEFDADELTLELVKRHFVQDKSTPAHRSLTLKHMHAWRLALSRGQRRILVCEDDVVLDKFFRAGLNRAIIASHDLPDGWLIFLGGADAKVPDAFFLSNGPLFKLPLPTAEAYLTDATAMQRRLAWLESHLINLPADQLINRIDRESDIDQYWLRDPIAEQGSVFGLFTSKLDKSRLKHGAAYNWSRYQWNKIRRRRIRSCWVQLRTLLRA